MSPKKSSKKKPKRKKDKKSDPSRITQGTVVAIAAGLVILTVLALIYQRDENLVSPQLRTAVTFTDVGQEDYQDLVYNAALNFLAKKRIMNGYNDGSFKPDAPINRAEFMKILVEGTVGTPASPKERCFTDVVPQEWYANYVCYAKDQGWVSGFPDGSYKPANTINQAEIAKIFVTSMGWNIDEFATQRLPEFVDPNEWFAPYLKVALAKNAILWDEVDPGKLLSRKEVAVMLFRVLLVDKLKISSFEEERIPELFAAEEIPFTPEPPPPTPEPPPEG